MSNKFTRKLSSQYHKYLRVWRLLKKPSMTEFKTISKVSAIGILIIGAVGFAISVLMNIVNSALEKRAAQLVAEMIVPILTNLR